ncbi:hypothetical protein NEOLEDRAFT_1129627 [Neolentinus lepideus HHB14362 ss-1]|uniref:Zn(2)-C6 fungal-type domain-containing protein n=1 Tax=Neolentinus lepideus HHB14362 ss-1 TaxID=1314782 RepID=A0A165UJQ2_9AGAM|nr:hypothetical protein NEOLEDRAFT_1129627 [Neolentinus lepideus HHB14362 ss-1]
MKGNSLRVQEQELKRARGAISCAECRRLKLKCDKTIPCSSCKRRGCASICPNGSLTTGQGTRFVLADTEKLHRKIQEMSDRIRQLEDALSILQGTITREPHPLLRRDLLKIKSGLELHGAAQGEGRANTGEEDEESETLDAFGTLAVREDGGATFYGRSAGSESLLLDHGSEEQPSAHVSEPPRPAYDLPPQLTTLSHSFPSKPPEYAATDLQTLIERYLPPYDRAWTLCECYLEQECWHYGAVTRRQLVEELFPYFYPESINGSAPFIRDPYAQHPPNSKDKESNSGPHALALMFVVFCFGALTDPNMPAAPDNDEAELYYQLSRAALNLEPILEKPPSVATVQTVSLMAIYQGMCSGEHSIETTWALWGLASKLAQSIGLHRDCARWNLSPGEVQKRRALFWELFITDCWQSLATGRLPTFSIPFVDTELPQDIEQTMAEDGTILPSFPYWKARFGKECVSAVVQGTLTARSPKYSVILELDRKIREMELPKYATAPAPQNRGLAETMQHFMPINYQHLTLLYVHRTFFAQALKDFPDDPMRSQYAPSFLAGYRSACDLLASVRESFEQYPREIARFWVLFTHGFSCSVMLASVVTHGTKSKVAQAALMELRLARDLYERAAPFGGRAVKFLPIIRRLYDKATQTYVDIRQQGLEPPRKDIFTPTRSDDKKDELSIFSGRTHTVATKVAQSSLSRRHPSESTSKASSSVTSPLEGSNGSTTSTPPAVSEAGHSPHSVDSEPYAGVHPALVHQLQGFDGELNAQMHDAYYKNAQMRQWVDEINSRIPVAQQHYAPQQVQVQAQAQPQYEPGPGTYHPQYSEPVQEYSGPPQETYVHEVYAHEIQQQPLPLQQPVSHQSAPHQSVPQQQLVDHNVYYEAGPTVPVQQHHGHWQHVSDPRMEQQQYMSGAVYHAHNPHAVDGHGAVLSDLPTEEPLQVQSNYSLHENWSAIMQQWQMPGR